MNPFTFVKETPDAWIYEGLAIPYGGPFGGQDLTGSHFTKDTDLCLEWFPDGGRPILYRHGFDPALKASPIGRETGAVREDGKGRWYQLQIDKAKEYASEVKQLADEGVLALSSGAVDHLVSISAKDGEIRRWPWVELSLVPNPANPEALVYQVKSADAVEHLRIVETAEPAAIIAAVKYDVAADDAAMGAGILGSLLYLISREADEPEQLAQLQAAADSVSAWIEAERAEIGTADETSEGPVAWASTDRPATREGRRNSTSDMTTIQGIHDATRDLGADCAAGKSAPAPRLVITAGTAADPDGDLGALTEAMKALATQRARQILHID